MRDRLLQSGSAKLREEYARMEPRRDAIAALFRARKLRNLTQHELAQRAGLSQGVVSRLESGGHSPRLETLERIARAMDFRLDLKLVDKRERGDAASVADAQRRRAGPATETLDAQPTDRQSECDRQMARPTASEYQLRNETAAAYRDQGYEVSIEKELDFLPGFRADLVARKGDQVRVIEVKPRTVLVNAGALVQLLRAIEERPGWSFDLVLAAEAEQSEPRRGMDPFNPGMCTVDSMKPSRYSTRATMSRPSCWPVWRLKRSLYCCLRTGTDWDSVSRSLLRCRRKRPFGA
ncbi:MAG: helix-turn-helix domain-containing protein [Chloroflexi bacterium]|nr:helix-turn-helix domain-containing protein [Chloroflexota bacterium]